MKTPLLSNKCRQCSASVTNRAHACPLCGVSRPVYANLTPIEKEYLASPPAIPGKYYYMPKRVNPKHNLLTNIKNEFSYYLTSPTMSFKFYVAILLTIVTGQMVVGGVGFPISFILFWPAILYITYDLISFTRAVTIALLISRLQLKGGASPYSVHFKIEEQLGQMLSGLNMILNTFFERTWTPSDVNQKNAALGFYQAISTLTNRIVKYGRVSLETSAIIWRNNVYSIVAEKDKTTQSKIISINNKIREGEALILRYCWFLHLHTIKDELETYVNDPGELRQEDFRREMIEGNQLSTHGPITERYSGNFQSVPYELPFRMRYFWHQQLMPAPLPSEEIIKKYPETIEFFESIQQVRQLKDGLEQQMILDCATSALGGVQDTENTMLEAQDIKTYEVYSQLLNIPEFQPNNDKLQSQIDRLNSQLRL